MTNEKKLWLETPEPGCQPADLAFLAIKDTFVSGDLSGHRLNVRYYHRENELTLRGKAIFGPGTQGPPDHVHGGAMAALLDEAMGGAAWLAGHPVVAANLNITFRQMLPLGMPCFVESEVTAVEGRKVRTKGLIRNRDSETIYSEGEALFIVLDKDHLGKMSDKVNAIMDRLAKREGR